MGGAFAAALCSSAKGRPFRGGNRRGRSEGQEGSAGLRHGRSQPAGYYSGRARQAEAGLSQGRDDHRAGNSPGLNSAAAAVVVAERRFAEQSGLKPIARLVAYGVGAVEPGLFGIGPVPAVRQALARAGWNLGDVERVEINEAFAAVPLAVLRELGWPEDIVNVEGGAIAHGHPIGATGAVLATRLLHSMRRDALRRGVVTLCIGGGQGIALVLEML